MALWRHSSGQQANPVAGLGFFWICVLLDWCFAVLVFCWIGVF